MTRPCRPLTLGVLAALVAAAGVVAGQQPSEPTGQPAPAAQVPQPPAFHTGVELLAVDVTALDDRGQPIPDLLPADFDVRIDGQERRVSSAQFISFDSRATAPLVESELEEGQGGGRAPGRLIIIVVDQENIRAGEGRTALRGAARFLDRLQPDDRVAFVAIPPPGARIDFTTDHTRIREALMQTVGRGSPQGPGADLGIAEALALHRGSNPLAIQAIIERECEGTRPGSRAREMCERDVYSEASLMISELRRKAGQSMRELRDLLEALRVYDAPKSLIFISEGLILESTGEAVSEIGVAAAAARTTIHVLLLDVPFVDMTQRSMPPTATEDRRMQVDGLEMLAGGARGSLLRMIGSSELIFDRLAREMSAYYLLGVEPVTGDRDGKRHRIDVKIRRRGVTVRSRREFRWTEPVWKEATPAERVTQALGSGAPATGLAVRATTYAYRDTDHAKVRLLLAAEVVPPTSASSPVSLGFALLDEKGSVVAGRVEEPHAVTAPEPLQYATAVAVEPGTYTLKVAATDATGRVGSTERTVRAWKLSGETLTVADLLLGPLPDPNQPVHPLLEPRIDSGRLLAYTEVYAEQAQMLSTLTVAMDVAQGESSARLLSVPSALAVDSDNRRGIVKGLLDVALLPPGSYVARLTISGPGSGATVAKLVRPFTIRPPARGAAGTASAGTDAAASLVPAPVRFDRAQALTPEALDEMLGAALRAGPPAAAPVQKAFERAKTGKLDGTARAAFEAGDQTRAALLRGLELLTQGQLDAAARQFNATQDLGQPFPPGAFYLGACFAAAGRDRDAAVWWQRAFDAGLKTPLLLRALGGARLRLGEPARAIELLKELPAQGTTSTADTRDLVIAYLATGQRDAAAALLEPYVAEHPDDAELVLAAAYLVYARKAAGQTKQTVTEDRDRMARYARAYTAAGGPHRELVEAWRAYVDKH